MRSAHGTCVPAGLAAKRYPAIVDSDRGDFFRIYVDPVLRRHLDRLHDERDVNVTNWVRNTLCEALERELGPEPKTPDTIHPALSIPPALQKVLIRPSPKSPLAPRSRAVPTKLIRPKFGASLALCVGTSLCVALLAQVLDNRPNRYTPRKPVARLQRTAVAKLGKLPKTLRVSGSIEALRYAPIRAPRLRGQQDVGDGYLTLAHLVEAGSIVEAGSVVAELELDGLARHIEESQSQLTLAKAQLKKKRAEILILQASERQKLLDARAVFEKAVLSLRLTTVKSAIEAEILRSTAKEKRTVMEQTERERELKQKVHAADILRQELAVKKETLHFEHLQHNYGELLVKAPIDGMVVHESIFNDNFQFAQVEEGNRFFPGTLFMRIVDPSHMAVRAAVNQVDALAIRAGYEATVTLDAYPSTRFPAKVVDFSSVASTGDDPMLLPSDTAKRYVQHFPARILIKAQDARVLPDLSASATVQLPTGKRGVIIPREAIRSSTGLDIYKFVHVEIGDGHYRKRRIRVQDTSDTEALIRSGVQLGDRVLLGDPP